MPNAGLFRRSVNDSSVPERPVPNAHLFAGSGDNDDAQNSSVQFEDVGFAEHDA